MGVFSVQRFAFYCPDCGELEITEQMPPGDGSAACLYCGAPARWWPIDAAGEIQPGGSAIPPPTFLKATVRQMSAAMSKA
jgi:hypothetical protein